MQCQGSIPVGYVLSRGSRYSRKFYLGEGDSSEVQSLALLYTIDRTNFLSDLGMCDYYVEDQFNDILKQKKIVNDRLSFMQVNTRSLQCNLDSLTNMLSHLDLKFSFIGISETWLKDISHTCDITPVIYQVTNLFINTALTLMVEVLVFI